MITILITVIALGISFLFTAGLVWLLCWLLPIIGITTIGSFVIAFSWKLVLVVWLIIALLRSVFYVSGKS